MRICRFLHQVRSPIKCSIIQLRKMSQNWQRRNNKIITACVSQQIIWFSRAATFQYIHVCGINVFWKIDNVSVITFGDTLFEKSSKYTNKVSNIDHFETYGMIQAYTGTHIIDENGWMQMKQGDILNVTDNELATWDKSTYFAISTQMFYIFIIECENNAHIKFGTQLYLICLY